MGQVVLTAVGSAIGGPIGGAIGSALGAALDRAAINALTPARQVGPRIPELRVMGAAEGAPLPAVFGRARVAGQVIWAARFKEKRVEGSTGGGKGGPKTYEYRYSLSFAVALCEGPIDGVGRVWADGKPLDLSGVTMRVHRGEADQAPDALIEAIEGAAPAYRGLAYAVFEDLPLATFGNRPPQLSFEVFRRPAGSALGLEDRLKGVCLIPGAGEFAYATQTMLRRASLTRTTAENLNNTDGRADIVVSLDQMQAQLPNVEEVTLVVAWFGTSLSLGDCEVKPGVETASKATRPFSWRVSGIGRDHAHVVSQVDGGPAFGGTPCDRSVLQAIAELKARGLKVGLYPFLLMDAPGYPWRGRIAGEEGAGAATEVASFFGAAAPEDFGASDGLPTYSGPAEWSWRRMVLHYARLAQLAGGVNTFLVGSELRGITTTRDAGGGYPAVAALRDLAADAKSILGTGCKVGYAADWSEYFGHQPADGSGDVAFHLDPLWADEAVDFVGIDFYPPLSDWRDGEGHLDAVAGFGGPHDAGYLATRLTAGEGFDWYYADEAARAAQARTAITDGAHGEPWVFRPKDLAAWWSHQHFDRPGGVRAPSPTAWVPMSKPIRLIEFGCPAADKGANAPNLFVDAKSTESSLPPFSDGTRDDIGQRRALEAVLAHYGPGAAGNPVSEIYGGPMVEAMSAWCWDARPFPDFPARAGVWADAPNWTLGHWLNGRAGTAEAAGLVEALAARAGVEIDPGEVGGALDGYVVDRPMRVRDALSPLAEVWGFAAAERGGEASLVARDGLLDLALSDDELALEDERAHARTASRVLEAPAQTLRLRFIDGAADYQTGAVAVRRETETGGGSADIDLPVVMTAGEAARVGRARLAEDLAASDAATVWVSPLAALRLEAGDRVTVAGLEGRWRVARVDVDEAPKLTLARIAEVADAGDGGVDWTPGPVVEPARPPVLMLLDLPPLPGAETNARPVAAVAAEPWRAYEVSAGVSADALSPRVRVERPAVVGETLSALLPGPLWRIDRAQRLEVRVEGAVLESRSLAAVLAGANGCAVQAPSGEWEVLQFLEAELIGAETWRLSGLLRGRLGSDAVMASTPAGAAFVLLTPDLARAEVAQAERGRPLLWRAAPAGGPAGGETMEETTFTWRGVAQRPWAPAHLRGRRLAGGDRVLSWVRRARVGGDAWDPDPPLGEEREVYRVEVLDGAGVVRRAEVTSPAFTYTAAMQAADFGGSAPSPLTVRVAQGSAVFGWGAWTMRMVG